MNRSQLLTYKTENNSFKFLIIKNRGLKLREAQHNMKITFVFNLKTEKNRYTLICLLLFNVKRTFKNHGKQTTKQLANFQAIVNVNLVGLFKLHLFHAIWNKRKSMSNVYFCGKRNSPLSEIKMLIVLICQTHKPLDDWHHSEGHFLHCLHSSVNYSLFLNKQKSVFWTRRIGFCKDIKLLVTLL